MSLLAKLRYQFMVKGVGAALLRLERWRSARRLRTRPPGRDAPFGPPLATSPWLKQLIAGHYLSGRYSTGARPVAWVTSGGPVEFLVALGYHVHYPENHGAVCGIRRVAERLCERAEDAGYGRDICSYARTDFGTVLGGATPVGRLPRPDLLLCCNNICQTVLHWYRVLADHYRVPLLLIDTPFLYRQAHDHEVEYVKRQLDQAVVVAERVAGRSLAPSRLEQAARLSKEAVELWARVLAAARARPAPISAFDAFIHMAPIVEMRGERFTVEYYRALLDELERRRQQGIAAVPGESKRLLWDNLPIWYRVRWLATWLAERGVALVASTYTHAWGELAPLMDSRRPLESAARVYLHPILNRSTGDKLRTIQQLAGDYSVDGVLLHSDRSCKPYSVGQLDQQKLLGRKLGIPALVMEADHNDPRVFSEAQTEARLQAFLEMLAG
ncbi:MAG: 2-hydroxyglutaryl-CoA dehydratase [Deltaproteobacteria bacterium]|nr:MAG: 2-hydroxyglutaryl-CoA dehydratase [Deltaproteobacteria bacterium]